MTCARRRIQELKELQLNVRAVVDKPADNVANAGKSLHSIGKPSFVNARAATSNESKNIRIETLRRCQIRDGKCNLTQCALAVHGDIQPDAEMYPDPSTLEVTAKVAQSACSPKRLKILNPF